MSTDKKTTTSKDAIEEAIKQLIDASIAKTGTIRGCIEADIAKIEQAYSVELPKQYRRFLLRMGGTAGEFLVGSDFLCKDLPNLRRNAELLLQQCRSKFKLSQSDFVFVVHQGYQFLFFNTTNSEDPPVFLFVEDDKSPKQISESFSEWLLMCVADEVEASRSLSKE